MATCQTCHSTGTMYKCTSCGNIWCRVCASQGKGSYPKLTSSNVCPYCGKMNSTEPLR